MDTPIRIEEFFDTDTHTLSYLVLEPASGACAIIDSVLGYDAASGRTHTTLADRQIARVRELGARLAWILETHVHADHLSAAAYLREHLGGAIVIGREVTQVQQVFGDLFHVGDDFARDGRQFDHLVADGDVLPLGVASLQALHTPGHTKACMTYVIREAVPPVAFVGDTLMAPDYGTARCDFPGGDARTLYQSINTILSLPPQTRLYLCHDYRPGGRELQSFHTVLEQREANIHVRNGISEEAFVTMRQARDATLDMPRLMLPSVQVNMRAGAMPPAESNGVRYLKIPLNAL